MIPERVIFTLIQMGVDAIVADTALIDRIIGDDVAAAELTKAKALFASNPPTVLHGYPRVGVPFPCFALTLAEDAPLQQYVGQGEEALLDDDDEILGNQFKDRVRGSFTIFVISENPDWTTWLYRILRRILKVGTNYLIDNRLDDPLISGADLMPDPRYTPEATYVRRLTVTVEYEDRWDDTDGLWDAIYGGTEERGTLGDIAHEDVGGGIHPYNPDDED